MENASSRMTSWSALLRRFRGRLFVLLAFWLGSAAPLQAHDPGLSSANLRLEGERLIAHLTFARLDIESLVAIDSNGDGRVAPEELAAARARLEELAQRALEVRFNGHIVPARGVSIALDESNAVHFHLSFSGQRDAHLSLRSVLLTRLARGHRQYLSLRDAAGRTLIERMLDANAGDIELHLDGATAWAATPRSFRQFLGLGVEHILTGYDHLLFLLALLLPGCSFRAAVKIITSFTLAHSLTLTLATLGLVWVPSRWAEPLIAMSIVYVGLENLLRRDSERRWLLTFAFGLVHGFGFASVLRDLGIGSGGGGAVVPLFAFNLGVELGQITLAGLALPAILMLRHHPSFASRVVPACSVVVALAGGYWLIQRTLLS